MKLKKQIKKIIQKTPGIKQLFEIFRKWFLVNWYLPSAVRLEASTLCQLRCTGCSFQNGNHAGLGGGYLTIENFRKFVDNNPYVKEIELSNYGEIFLNPDLIKIMKYAKEKGVALTANNGCNFNTVSDEQIKALVETQFRSISLSIGGASQEVYAQYRRGGNYDKVIDNVKKLQDLKLKKNSLYPELKWQYIIMESTELEIEKAKEKANELGIPIYFKLTWDRNYIPKNEDYIKKTTGLKFLTRDSYEENNRDSYLSDICREMFYKPQINWDGKLLGCCEVQHEHYNIDVFESGLNKALRSKQFRKAKKSLLILNPDEKEYGKIACFNCPRRLTRQKYNKTLEI